MNHFSIWYELFCLLDFKSQLALHLSCISIKDNISITNLVIRKKYSRGINKKSLKKILFFDIALSKKYDYRIDLTFLKKLVINGSCGVDDSMIKNLDLIELDASNNFEITNISHMKNLKVLYANGVCGITQQEIQKLDLIELYVNDNYSIYNVSHMKNLKVLHANGNSRIGCDGILGLDLYEISFQNNYRINSTSASIMKNIKRIIVSRYKTIDPSIDQLASKL